MSEVTRFKGNSQTWKLLQATYPQLAEASVLWDRDCPELTLLELTVGLDKYSNFSSPWKKDGYYIYATVEPNDGIRHADFDFQDQKWCKRS